MSLLKELKNSFLNTFLNHKAESILIILMSAAYLCMTRYIFALNDKLANSTTEIYIHLPLFLVAIYIFRHFRLAYWTAFLVAFACIFAVIKFGFYDENFVIFTIIAFILLLSEGFAKQNEIFIQNALKKLSNLSLAITLGLAILVIVVILKSSTEYLFGVYFMDEELFLVSFLASSCWFFMAFEDANFTFKSPVLNKIFSFLLTPTLLLYTLIIYAYIAKIAIFSGLPRGGVAYIVLFYLGFGIVFGALAELLKEQKWQKFYCYFPLISLAPIALLWFGIVERISTYGYTPERIYLCGVALLASVIYALWISKIFFSLRLISLLCIATIIVIYFIIDVRYITLSSQLARFDEMVRKFDLTTDTKTKFSSLNKNEQENVQSMAYTLRQLDANYAAAPQLIETLANMPDELHSTIVKFELENGDNIDVKDYRYVAKLDKYGYCDTDDKCEFEISHNGKTYAADINKHILDVLTQHNIANIAELDKQPQIYRQILELRTPLGAIIFKEIYLHRSANKIYVSSFATSFMLTKD